MIVTLVAGLVHAWCYGVGDSNVLFALWGGRSDRYGTHIHACIQTHLLHFGDCQSKYLGGVLDVCAATQALGPTHIYVALTCNKSQYGYSILSQVETHSCFDLKA